MENPADESQVAELAATPLPEFGRAITEARRALRRRARGPRCAPAERARRVLHALVDHVEANGAALVADDGRRGGPADDVRRMACSSARGVALARRPIDLYLSMTHEQANPVPVDELVRGRVALSVRRHEPVGVVAAITPYNAAIIMAFQKLIPALMAGNSVILRPSPLTPHLVADLRRGRRRGGAAARRAQRRGRGRRRRRRAAHHAPRGRHGVVHRFDRGRASRSWPRPRRR